MKLWNQTGIRRKQFTPGSAGAPHQSRCEERPVPHYHLLTMVECPGRRSGRERKGVVEDEEDRKSVV